jgi:hypothetical protein
VSLTARTKAGSLPFLTTTGAGHLVASGALPALQVKLTVTGERYQPEGDFGSALDMRTVIDGDVTAGLGAAMTVTVPFACAAAA